MSSATIGWVGGDSCGGSVHRGESPGHVEVPRGQELSKGDEGRPQEREGTQDTGAWTPGEGSVAGGKQPGELRAGAGEEQRLWLGVAS